MGWIRLLQCLYSACEHAECLVIPTLCEMLSFAGGRLCHSAEGRIWPVECCPLAAVHGAGWCLGSLLRSVRSVTRRHRYCKSLSIHTIYIHTVARMTHKSFLPFLENATAWILPFTAGGFLYISLVNVVPDLLEESSLRYASLWGLQTHQGPLIKTWLCSTIVGKSSTGYL